MHHELPAAANCKLEYLEGVREAVWSPPACEQFGLSEGFKDPLWQIGQHPMVPKDAAVRLSLACDVSISTSLVVILLTAVTALNLRRPLSSLRETLLSFARPLEVFRLPACGSRLQ